MNDKTSKSTMEKLNDAASNPEAIEAVSKGLENPTLRIKQIGETPGTRLKNTKIMCVACKKGAIMKETHVYHEYNPMSGPPVYGPGSKNQFHLVTQESIYCEHCGVSYHHLPK